MSLAIAEVTAAVWIGDREGTNALALSLDVADLVAGLAPDIIVAKISGGCFTGIFLS